MARLCEPCRFHSADDSLTACPECGGPVKFTLLPPQGSDPNLLYNEVDRGGAPQPTGLGDFFRGKMLVVTVLVVVGLFGAVVGVWYLKGDRFSDKVAKLKTGMRMTEAMRIMGDDNKPKAKRPSLNITIGGAPEDPNRFSDFDAPIDTSGEGFVEYEGGGEAVRIDYRNGLVTNVQVKRAEGGLRKKYTVQ